MRVALSLYEGTASMAACRVVKSPLPSAATTKSGSAPSRETGLPGKSPALISPGAVPKTVRNITTTRDMD